MYTHSWTPHCPTHPRALASRKQGSEIIYFLFCPLPAVTHCLKWEVFTADLDTQVVLCIVLNPFFFCSRLHSAPVGTCLTWRKKYKTTGSLQMHWPFRREEDSASSCSKGSWHSPRGTFPFLPLPSILHIPEQRLKQEHPVAQLHRLPCSTSGYWIYTISKLQHSPTSSSRIIWVSSWENKTKYLKLFARNS